MLQREGKEVSMKGKLQEVKDKEMDPLFWMKVPALAKTQGGKEKESWWWINVLTGVVSNECPPQDEIVGGLLAEEPGLGTFLLPFFSPVLFLSFLPEGRRLCMQRNVTMLFVLEVKLLCHPDNLLFR